MDGMTPATEAGRRLLDGFAPPPKPDAQELHRRSAMGRRTKVAAGIVAIEEEAARATSTPTGLREAAQAYIDWRDKRAAQWDAVARHDHEHGMTPCPEWDELTSEPFDIDQRLDDAIRAALASGTGEPGLDEQAERVSIALNRAGIVVNAAVHRIIRAALQGADR